jgi:hypothetical protein
MYPRHFTPMLVSGAPPNECLGFLFLLFGPQLYTFVSFIYLLLSLALFIPFPITHTQPSLSYSSPSTSTASSPTPTQPSRSVVLFRQRRSTTTGGSLFSSSTSLLSTRVKFHEHSTAMVTKIITLLIICLRTVI